MIKQFQHLKSEFWLLTIGLLLVAACGHDTKSDTDNEESTDNEVDTSDHNGPSEEIIPEEGLDPVEPYSCKDRAYKDAWTPGYTPDESVVEESEILVDVMSISEKADQMRGMPHAGGTNWTDTFRQPDNEDRDIRGFYFRDGPRGVNLDAPSTISGDTGTSTAFPVPMARGAAFDMDLEYRIGVATGDETLASGNTMMLAPTINLLRHPAWGRSQETYGEDPFLLGRLGSAYVVGVQEFIPACAKHYVANNIENGRFSMNAEMDEQTLMEIYTWAYEMTIKDAGVACMMMAYNPVNGVKSTENEHLMTTVLRDRLGFKGFTLTDWWAMTNKFSANLTAASYQEVAKQGILAGLDMELPWALNYEYIEALVENDEIKQSVIDASVQRILEQKLRFEVDSMKGPWGLKEPSTELNGGDITGNGDHIELAEEAALKSMVLLKNDDDTLPISRDDVSTIAVLGLEVSFDLSEANGVPSGSIDFATGVLTGDRGSSRVDVDEDDSVGPFDGIAAAAGSDIDVVTGNTADAAADADFIVVVAGLTPEDEGEEYTGAGDRSNFELDGKRDDSPQNDLIADAAALGKPMVVVLIGGSVIDMPWLDDVPAVVMSWYPGMVGGKALGKLLFGDENFGGKLPITWPDSWKDLPDFVGDDSTEMAYFVGYRWFDEEGVTPLYPFGYGLSYTTFEYSNLQVPCTDVTKNGVIDVMVDVKNTGEVTGDEVIFVFASYPDSDERRSKKELKGFYRVNLEPEQAKRVTIPVRVSDLKYWDGGEKGDWKVETGTVEFMVGPSSDDLPLTAETTVVDGE